MLSLSNRLRASSRARELAADSGTAHRQHKTQSNLTFFSYLNIVRTSLCPSIGSCLSLYFPHEILWVIALAHGDADSVWGAPECLDSIEVGGAKQGDPVHLQDTVTNLQTPVLGSCSSSGNLIRNKQTVTPSSLSYT